MDRIPNKISEDYGAETLDWNGNTLKADWNSMLWHTRSSPTRSDSCG